MTVAYSDVVRDMVDANREEQALLVDCKGDEKHLTRAGHIAVVASNGEFATKCRLLVETRGR
jgi:hypothetical protein